MRILLLALSDILPFIVAKILNPSNKYCAIVTDEVEPSRKFLSQFGFPAERVFAFHELKECAENFYYDCLLHISDGRTAWTIYDYLKKNNVPTQKFFHVILDNGKENCFLLDRAMCYYSEHAAEFEMIATGISLVEAGLETKQFRRKLFNLHLR